MRSTYWLLLDNLHQNWPAHANMTQAEFEHAMQWARDMSFVNKDGKLTIDGRAYWASNCHKRPNG